MVNWKSWDLINLFSDVSELPIEIGLRLAGSSKEEQLHMYELLSPTHRLLDIWCGHPGLSKDVFSPEDWTDDDWNRSFVYLHPQLINEHFQSDLVDCVSQNKLFNFNNHLSAHEGTVTLDPMGASCLLLLLDGPKSFHALSERWLKLRPLNPVSLEPTSPEEVRALLAGQMQALEQLGYILLDRRI